MRVCERERERERQRERKQALVRNEIGAQKVATHSGVRWLKMTGRKWPKMWNGEWATGSRL